VQASDVQGIGFAATCSLVVLDASFQPIAVSDTGTEQFHDIDLFIIKNIDIYDNMSMFFFVIFYLYFLIDTQ